MLVGPRATTHRAHALTSDGTESVPITTDVVSSNLDQGEVLVSDLRQVSGFLRVLRFPPPIKRTTTI
jgi:hypothetical protein